jgi:mRNA-degrading endonuclease RelE of RelBE toxin-antitoxin system
MAVEFQIQIAKSAIEDLKMLRAFDRQRVIEQMETQLTHDPAKPTRNRKCLTGAVPGFEHVPPLWELRVGEVRVFYDVAPQESTVYVRAVRRKTQKQRTEDIIK